jgi:hypothetical protein
VTCGFATLRRALSRRPRAVGAGTIQLLWTVRARAKARGRNLPLQRMFSSCRFSPPLLAAPACSGRRRPGPASAKPSALAPRHPPRCFLQAFGLNSPLALRSRLSSFISELASHEVPGFGAPALPSALGLEALAPALAIARDDGVFRIRPAVASLPPPPRQPAGESRAETWPPLPVQRHPRGSNRVGEEGRASEELSESPGQGAYFGCGIAGSSA